jgi:uncharacterized protein YcbK (DUF882 family)
MATDITARTRRKTVLIQAGHRAPRDPAHENTGTPGEIKTVTEIRARLAKKLRGDGRFAVKLVPGKIEWGTPADAALFLHCDGSVHPSVRGFSLGYPPGYPVNKRLAELVASELDDIPGAPPRRADNYTDDMKYYYGYRRVDADGPEVLVEHGFLTNARDRAWIASNLDGIAEAEYRALCHFFFPKVPQLTAGVDVSEAVEAPGVADLEIGRELHEAEPDERTVLSANFRPSEFDCHCPSCGQAKVPGAAMPALRKLAREVLQPLRDEFGPCTIHSGYRTYRHNRHVGGEARSFHIYDLRPNAPAADMTFATGSVKQWARRARQLFPQGTGGIGRYPSQKFIHLDLGPARDW